jgi:transcription initiation factor TFIID subunit 11
VTKIFAGEIIERARAIQTQWLEASGESQVDVSEAKGAVTPWKPLKEGEKEVRRGPLTPDHLREALRRYKMERAGGMAGLMGLDRLQHPTGVERYGIKARGRRLLK